MIELSRHGDVSLVCDVCRKPITVAGQAIVLRSPVGTARFVHKGECDRLDERLWPRRTGWIELVELLDELRLAVGAEDRQARGQGGPGE
jgi:hypothetical protein